MTLIQLSSTVSQTASGSAISLLLWALAVIALGLGARLLVRRLRATAAETIVHGDFTAFTLEALANAARLDGRASETELAAIEHALRDIAGATFDRERIGVAIDGAKLGKDELVAYLQENGRGFSHAQKTQFLKALLTVFVADGRFEESEHHALVEYTSAIGFDRQEAPQRLRGLLHDMARQRIT